ncbi:M23 family metallopeptidase [Ponticaulis sp.]|uniref:M23 family metallopeptidase n=1 Tax=Ponticaulis sp. TaxID=2020902 RepID=UPI000B6D2206|nr:M23 family metallopeptidase [Ponticaulis sp.]MAI89546.1 peptidase M23 [Ponticaulis sp.]OUY00577.1 MAG: peptidase M23 [Hyphomonadaceae bacterium TMED5]
MRDMHGKARTWLERTFPERQIYHRSGGNVQYISISPRKQMLAAGVAALAAGWCVFATFSVISQGPRLSAHNDALDRNEATFQRWVSETNARAATAQSLLEERTEAFQRATVELEQRHEILRMLLEGLQSPDNVNASTLQGNNSSFLMEASIEEGAPRQARSTPIVNASFDVAGFRADIDQLSQNQYAFLDEAEQVAVDRSEQARGILQLTGVGIGRFEEQREMGGPLVEHVSTGSSYGVNDIDSQFSNRVVQVAARMEESNYYQNVIDTLPLGEPISVPFRETSGYGLRTDPFNRRPAFHAGMDMAAYHRAPIVAAGPGVVTFAGPRSGYGRLVEIDHGFGFRTRYGHLNSVDVQVGDEIQMGDLVGRMGTTGRSTGPHLHYEVWFRGKTYNPVNFLRAGQHVHQG